MTPQIIGDIEYEDAAKSEPLPLRSIVEDHIKSGLDPDKLIIIGFFVHTFRNVAPPPSRRHMLAMNHHNGTSEHRDKFFDHKLILDFMKIKHIIIEFNSTNVQPPMPPFPELQGLGTGLRKARKIFAKMLNATELERLLRGVAIFLYQEINTEHIPYYLDSFDKVAEEKLIKKIRLFREKY